MSGDDDAERQREVARWFVVADEDRRVAQACLDLAEPALGAAAYHCQQAAEKLIKDLLISAGIAFRKTHDLDELADLLLPERPALEDLLAGLRPVTVWGVAFRYPGIEDIAGQPPPAGEIAKVLVRLAQLRAVQPG